jgi:hypothetical protein
VAGPDFLTVEEAARVLRIGRTAAYLAAKRYRETGGADGLPVVAIRGSLRVPRRLLEAMAGGPIDTGDASTPVASGDKHRRPARASTPASTPASTNGRTSKSKRNATTDAQRSLPFTV